MKITVLMGSPNRNGSTSILVNEFKRGAEEAGHSCEVIDVCHSNIHPCIGCVACGYEGPCVWCLCFCNQAIIICYILLIAIYLDI